MSRVGKILVDPSVRQCSHCANTLASLAWANATGFPPKKPHTPGFDPLIGQVTDSDNVGNRAMTGANPANTAASLDLGLQTWVVPKGGEYFFSPSISVLRDVFAKKAVGVHQHEL